VPAAFNYKPYAVGLAVTVAVVVAAWMAGRHSSVPSGQRDDAYAAQVTISGAKVSAAESMMAGGVVYYDGTIENRGGRTLTGYIVALTFSSIDGKPLETDRRVLLDDRFRPVPPHSTRNFEIGFDKVPAGWNQAPPASQATAVYVR
jgi:hypothetical protein